MISFNDLSLTGVYYKLTFAAFFLYFMMISLPSFRWYVCGRECCSLSLYADSNLSRGCLTIRKDTELLNAFLRAFKDGLGYLCRARFKGTVFVFFKKLGLYLKENRKNTCTVFQFSDVLFLVYCCYFCKILSECLFFNMWA